MIFLCSTLQMLTNIENRLEELFQQIELLPSDKVEAAEKVNQLFDIFCHFVILAILLINNLYYKALFDD